MPRAENGLVDDPHDDQQPRSVGLVLGAGGGPGWAWMVGCLGALAEIAGWDARSADLIIGTSAGAGIGATLRAGLGPRDQLRQYRDEALSAEGETLFDRARAVERRARPGGAAPTPAGRALGDGPAEAADGANGVNGGGVSTRPASAVLALRSMRYWPPRAGLAFAGIQARGHHDHDGLGARLDALHDGPWPSRPLWITAVRMDNGRRVVFGRDGVDPGRVGTAVEASSAVPGWYAPVRIGAHDYVDGAAWSTTNADLLAGLGFDLALVLAPQSVTSTRLGRHVRSLPRAYHRSMLSREVDVVHRNGTDVVVLEPTPDDVELLSVPRDRLDDERRRELAERGHRLTVRRLATDASLAPLAGLAERRPEASHER
jgi:NTE family protein